jgi:GR25 family glycosyltransferase involved in LPS biosynthesis
MQAQFNRLALPVEFIEAVDGRLLSQKEIANGYSKWRTCFCHGKRLSRGEIGCALSHLKFYRNVLERGTAGFVFEDDVELGDNIKRVLGEIEKFLASKTAPTLVQLPGLERDLPISVENMNNFIKVFSPIGTYAYGVNLSAAELLLNVFNPIKCPIDYYRYLIRHYGLEVFAYSEKILSVDMESESTVGLERFKTYKGFRWMCFKAWRIIGKTIDSIMRLFAESRGH